MRRDDERTLPKELGRLMRAADEDWHRSRSRLQGGAATVELWGGHDLQHAAARVHPMEHELRVDVTAGSAACAQIFNAADELRGQKLMVRLGRHRSINARVVCFFGRRVIGSSPSAAAGFQMFDWTLQDAERQLHFPTDDN